MVAAEVEVLRGDEVIFSFDEVVDLESGASWIELDDGTILRLQDDNLFLQGEDVADAPTAKWIRMSEATTAEFIDDLSQDAGVVAAQVLKSSPLVEFSRSLLTATEVSEIGREVVAGSATTHSLATTTVDGDRTPVEVWVSDADKLLRLRFLTDVAQSGPVEVVVDVVDPWMQDVPALTEAMILDEGAIVPTTVPEVTAPPPVTTVVLPSVEPDVTVGPDPTTVTAQVVVDALNSQRAVTEVGVGCFEDYDGVTSSAGCAPLPSEANRAAMCGSVASLVSALEVGAGPWVYELIALDMMAWKASLPADVPNWYFVNQESIGFYVLQSEGLGYAYGLDAIDDVAAAWDSEPELGTGDRGYRIDWAVHALTEICGLRSVPDTYDEEIPFMEERPPSPWDSVSPEAFPYSEGAVGPRVAEIQALLIMSGAPVGESRADGYFGPATTSAVSFFQTFAGLPETGVVDDATYRALQEEAKCHGGDVCLLIEMGPEDE